jgi:hypothetical protein
VAHITQDPFLNRAATFGRVPHLTVGQTRMLHRSSALNRPPFLGSPSSAPTSACRRRRSRSSAPDHNSSPPGRNPEQKVSLFFPNPKPMVFSLPPRVLLTRRRTASPPASLARLPSLWDRASNAWQACQSPVGVWSHAPTHTWPCRMRFVESCVGGQSSLRLMAVRAAPAASDPTGSCAPIQYLRSHTACPFSPSRTGSRQDPVHCHLGSQTVATCATAGYKPLTWPPPHQQKLSSSQPVARLKLALVSQ